MGKIENKNNDTFINLSILNHTTSVLYSLPVISYQEGQKMLYKHIIIPQVNNNGYDV